MFFTWFGMNFFTAREQFLCSWWPNWWLKPMELYSQIYHLISHRFVHETSWSLLDFFFFLPLLVTVFFFCFISVGCQRLDNLHTQHGLPELGLESSNNSTVHNDHFLNINTINRLTFPYLPILPPNYNTYS